MSRRIALLAGSLAAVMWVFPSSATGQSTNVNSVMHIATRPAEGRPLPLFKTTLLNDLPFNSGSLEGAPAVLLIWAADCPHSMALRQDFSEAIRRIRAEGARFFIADITGNRESSIAALHDVDFSQVIVADIVREAFLNHEVAELLGPDVKLGLLTPTVVILDDSGVVRVSTDWDSMETVVDLLRGLRSTETSMAERVD